MPSYPTNLQLQQALRPFPQFSGIDSNASGQNDGHSTYHALETSFEHRFAKGLYLMATYTFCKLISTSNGEDANRDTLGAAQNQYNRRLDKAVAYNEDTPHNIHIGYIYDLPVGKGKAFLNSMPTVLNAVFGNWKVSGDPHLRFRHAAVDQLRPELLRRGQQCPLQFRARRHHRPDSAHQSQLDLEPRQHRHHGPRANSVPQPGGLHPAGEYDLRRHPSPDVVPAPALDRQRRPGAF